MLDKNDVIDWKNASYRILAILKDKAVLYPMNQNGFSLEEVTVGELHKAQEAGNLAVIDDPYISLRYKTPKGRTLEKMKSNFELIGPVLAKGDSILTNSTERTRALTELSGSDASKRRKVCRLLALYWKKGQCEAALLPDYGRNTKPRNCKRKPGRRFSNPDITPPPLDDELRNLFRRIVDKYVLKADGMSLAGAYTVLVTDYLESHPEATPGTAPSFYQFRYFFRKYKKFPERLKARTPGFVYEKDKRALQSSVWSIADGIGKIYAIDSTQADVFLVSESDRSKLTGRPTLYLVVDYYSGMIVGMHVALEAAQFSSAAAALYNACSDKASFLSQYSDHVLPQEWAVSGIPHTLCADNGELTGAQIESFARANNVQIVNTKAYRGDQKGVVERALGLVMERVKPHVIAAPSPVKLKKEGAVDQRGNAALTLSEYRQIVINAIVDINSRALAETPPDYPYNATPTPNGIWKWCQQVNGGKSFLQRAPKSDLLARSLMPRFEATVSRNGIRAEKLTYDCERARELGWFERDRNAPREKSPLLAINPDDVGRAWIFPDADTSPEDAWSCSLSGESERFNGRALFEVRAARRQQKASYDSAVLSSRVIQGQCHKKNEKIAKAAQSARTAPQENLTERLKAIADNRHSDRALEARRRSGTTVAEDPQHIEPRNTDNPYDLPDDLEDFDE